MDLPIAGVPFPVAIVQTVTVLAPVVGGAIVVQTSAPTPPAVSRQPAIMVAT